MNMFGVGILFRVKCDYQHISEIKNTLPFHIKTSIIFTVIDKACLYGRHKAESGIEAIYRVGLWICFLDVDTIFSNFFGY